MKIEFAKEKSEYSHLITELLNLKLTIGQRHKIINRMAEIERLFKMYDDSIQIIVTTKKTNPFPSYPAMTMENIKK